MGISDFNNFFQFFNCSSHTILYYFQGYNIVIISWLRTLHFNRCYCFGGIRAVASYIWGWQLPLIQILFPSLSQSCVLKWNLPGRNQWAHQPRDSWVFPWSVRGKCQATLSLTCRPLLISSCLVICLSDALPLLTVVIYLLSRHFLQSFTIFLNPNFMTPCG